MKILITGGAGFIGSNFVYYYLERHPDWDVVCIDALTYAAKLKTLDRAIKNNKFKFIKGDITDREFIFKIFEEEGFQVVINFAAESHVDKSIEDSTIFLKTNILGVQILMDACKEFNVSRYHQVSTDEVYGDLPINRPDLKFTELSPVQASSPYAASKAAADLLVQSYYRTYSLPVTISRCSNNYGPYQFLEKLIPSMVVRALQGKKLYIYGDGCNVRDWLHVDDHCSAIDLILKEGESGEVYNIGGNSEKNNLEVVGRILEEMGKNHDLIEFTEDRPGHDLRYAIDAAKMKLNFGWEPTIAFEEGIVSTIRWYIENEAWWDNR
ncbi:MAG: dTDP-glucose 4,6-dehydratase [Peptostreptococcaceae bacterium]|nr:dTDP-glucose 4,6-dehydratase [Peptostreptococcaceae bacterium]